MTRKHQAVGWRETPWTPERLDQLRALAESGVIVKKAAEQLGTTRSAISAAASRHGISFNGNKLWNPERLAQLREFANAGLRKREAAEKFGVTYHAIQHAAVRHGVEFHGKADKTNCIKQKWVNHKKPLVPPLGDRSDEIARYIAEHGVTRCPAAFCAPSPQGAVS